MRLASPLSRKRARIEIIPLIDIMFFLLATFIMVSLSMIQNLGVPVNLPSARSSQEDPGKASATIVVSKDGGIHWNKEATALEDLPGRLAALLASDTDPKVFIHGDEAADFGMVVKVLDAVRGAGVKRTAIRTTKPPKG
jgi:biopolymer transport protein ExbD